MTKLGGAEWFLIAPHQTVPLISTIDVTHEIPPGDYVGPVVAAAYNSNTNQTGSLEITPTNPRFVPSSGDRPYPNFLYDSQVTNNNPFYFGFAVEIFYDG